MARTPRSQFRGPEFEIPGQGTRPHMPKVEGTVHAATKTDDPECQK